MDVVYTVYAVQLVGTAFLALLLGRFYGTYGHSYLREWSWSWVALFIYVAGGLIALVGTRTLPPQHVVRLSVTVTTLFAGYSHIALLLLGTYAVACGKAVPARWRRGLLGGCALLGLGLALAFSGDPTLGNLRFFTRVGVRSGVTAIAYIGAALWLGKDSGWRRGSGRAIVVGAFLLYGLEQLNYFAFIAIEFLELGAFGRGMALMGYIDFTLQFALGLGMVIWLLEDERFELARTAEALRDSQEQLRHSQRLEAVGQLAGGVAHDFNNLLTVITGHSQRLLHRLTDRHEDTHDIRFIEEAASRGADLVRQLLAFSRQQVLAPQYVDVNGVVRDVRSMLRRSLGEDISVETNLAADLGWVRVDRTQLEQVVMNLALNARDAMPAGGGLTISTRNVDVRMKDGDSLAGMVPGAHVELIVRDTGSGMDEETRRHIFDPFYTTKEVGQGSGLGMATVYGVVRQSGGAIAIDSSAGKGTVVTIHLPRVARPDAEGQTDDALTTEAAVPPPTKGTVLVVEDEERIRGLLAAVLGDNGYDVVAARDGREALEVAQGNGRAVDLVLTDVVMPRMGGPELAERLEAIDPTVKVIFMSGYSEEIVASRLTTQNRALLEKPFSLAEMLEQVRASLAS